MTAVAVTDVGIIGAGRLGQAMARTALRAGRSVVIANSRGPESLAAIVSDLGAGVTAGTAGGGPSAGIVVSALPRDQVRAAGGGLAWERQSVIAVAHKRKPHHTDGRASGADSTR